MLNNKYVLFCIKYLHPYTIPLKVLLIFTLIKNRESASWVEHAWCTIHGAEDKVYELEKYFTFRYLLSSIWSIVFHTFKFQVT